MMNNRNYSILDFIKDATILYLFIAFIVWVSGIYSRVPNTDLVQLAVILFVLIAIMKVVITCTALILGLKYINKNLIILSILILLAGFIGGVYFALSSNTLPSKLTVYSNIGDSAENENRLIKEVDIYKILLYNIILIASAVIGFFIIRSFYELALTGFYFGYILTISIVLGKSPFVLLVSTLPHGIFEIPAIIIAGAAGFKIPYEIIRYLAGKKEQILTKEDLKEYLTLALISIILIVIAAFIEAYITPKIAEYFLYKNFN